MHNLYDLIITELRVGGVLIFSYSRDISFKPVKYSCITENQINKLLKYSTVISTIVTRVLECLRVITEELLSTRRKVSDYFGLQKGADGKTLDDESAVC